MRQRKDLVVQSSWIEEWGARTDIAGAQESVTTGGGLVIGPAGVSCGARLCCPADSVKDRQPAICRFLAEIRTARRLRMSPASLQEASHMKNDDCFKTLVGLGLALAVGLAPARALAEMSTSDGFETKSNWSPDGQGGAVSFVGGSDPYAKLTAGNGSSWISVGRSIAVPGFTYYAAVHCTTKFAVDVAYLSAKVSVEVIDIASWTYISRKTYGPISSYYSWLNFSTDEWVAPSPNVFVRLVVSSGSGISGTVAYVDDMTTSCR
jgi:hypothetical protein